MDTTWGCDFFNAVVSHLVAACIVDYDMCFDGAVASSPRVNEGVSHPE